MNSKLIKVFLKKFVYEILSFCNKYIPKQNKIFIYSGSVLGDNNEAFFRYLVENTKEKVFCIANKHLLYDKGSFYFKKDSFWNALFYVLTSKIVVDDHMHCVKVKPASNQLILNLWHGNPLKKLAPHPFVENGQYYSKIFYGAEIFKLPMMNCFECAENKMFLSGLQRNDYLKKRMLNGPKKILWLPTYRQWGKIKLTANDLPIVRKDNVERLDSLLKKENIILYIKAHPLQSSSLMHFFKSELKNIRLISDEDLLLQNKPLYVFLSEADALLTDYSSVFFDFLLLNRPIGFTIDDIEEYKKNVGFVVDNPLDLMPGPHLKNFDDLLRFVEDVANGSDLYEKKRSEVNDVVNPCHTANNCAETYSLIKEFMYYGKK